MRNETSRESPVQVDPRVIDLAQDMARVLKDANYKGELTFTWAGKTLVRAEWTNDKDIAVTFPEPSDTPREPSVSPYVAPDQVYVLHDGRFGWGIDGPHSEGRDLSETYRILNQISSPTAFVLLRHDERGFPRLEDVTATAKGSGRKPCIVPDCENDHPHAPGRACWDA